VLINLEFQSIATLFSIRKRQLNQRQPEARSVNRPCVFAHTQSSQTQQRQPTMPMLNPFKKYDVHHFKDHVFVPLDQAPPRHASVVAENQRRESIRRASLAESEQTKVDVNDNAALEKGRSASSDSVDGRLTLQALREEVEADIAASGHDSAYDRKSKVINKAIQDIGMGRCVLLAVHSLVQLLWFFDDF
jgi:hypothetical protein